MTQAEFVETYNGYDIFRDRDLRAWFATPEFPGPAEANGGCEAVTYPSRTAIRRAIDATYAAPRGGAS